ncbi:MAG: hypothetical protein LBJ24_02675 [Treponema sp.]|jgi:hypothetical protein|nr:hypothetical protein [Treponema sp.]
MPKHTKDIFELPLKFVFTEEGASAFMRQNKRLVRMKMRDYTEEYGVSLEKITPAAIQRMLIIDYISKIEISGVEPVAGRKELIDLSKLIIYGLLYRQHNITALTRMLGSEPIKKWNRANPFTVLDGKTQFKEGFLELFLREHNDGIAALRKDILAPIAASITKNEGLQQDEKDTQLLLCGKFLDELNPIIWFVLLKFRGPRREGGGQSSDFFILMGEVRNSLAEFLKKSVVAEYAALMIIELAVNIENSNMLREEQLREPGRRITMQAILTDPQLRSVLIGELRKKNSLVTFSWKIGGGSSSIGTGGRFQLTLYDRDSHFQEIRDSIETKKTADLSRRNLSDLYQDLARKGADSELGLYYLSYLNEACERVGIKFESVVNEVQDTTVITLLFSL